MLLIVWLTGELDIGNRCLLASCKKMTDREGQDHWGLLASNLGIESREEAVKPPTKDVAAAEKEAASSEAPVEPAPQEEVVLGVEATAYVKKAPQASRTADDWARLASGLGIALPPEESAPPAVQETPAAAPVPMAEPVVEKALDQPSAESEVVAEQWTESVIELMEESLESTEPGIQEPITPQASDERRPERRRRRRRRRSRRTAEGEAGAVRSEELQDTTGSEPGEAASDVEAASPEQRIEEEVFPGETAAAQPSVEGEPQPGRSRRRRRRRGGDRRRDRERPDREGGSPTKTESVMSPEVATSEISAVEPPTAGECSAEERTPAEPDDDLGEEFDEDRTDKDGHRAIPSWDEAIAYMVDRNMEARARKPDSGSSRSRGRGRGRGRD